MKRSPIARKSKRARKSRVGKLGIVRLDAQGMAELRARVYDRAGGLCELKLPGCWRYAGWKSGELCYIKSRGAGGSDTEENTQWGCAHCHSKPHNCGGKPCPPNPVQRKLDLHGSAMGAESNHAD